MKQALLALACLAPGGDVVHQRPVARLRSIEPLSSFNGDRVAYGPIPR